jgi:DeoR family transcriptional regulator, suf operon transcriptional repressor
VESVPVVLIDLSAAQRQVLVALKRRSEATADELAESLAITPSAVRQHLAALRSAGLVASRQERGRPGRPADLYHGTQLGEGLFARTGEDLSVELLGDIEQEDPGMVPRVFERRRRRRVEGVRQQLAGKDLGEKVTTRVEILEGEGSMADVDGIGDERYRVTLHSCAIWAVASRYSEACDTELEFLREVLPETRIQRVAHKVAGAYVCGYEVGPFPPGRPSASGDPAVVVARPQG